MSEFECRNGHILSSHEIISRNRCPICLEPIVRMDGMSERELAMIEREWEREYGDKEE